MRIQIRSYVACEWSPSNRDRCSFVSARDSLPCQGKYLTNRAGHHYGVVRVSTPPPPSANLAWIPIRFGSSLQPDWSWSVHVFISAWPCLSRRYLSYAAHTFPWPWLPGPLIMWPVPQSTFASALRQRTRARLDKQSHSVCSPSWVKCPFKTSEAAHYLHNAGLWVGIDSHHLTHYELFSNYLTIYNGAKQPVKTTTSYWSIYGVMITFIFN